MADALPSSCLIIFLYLATGAHSLSDSRVQIPSTKINMQLQALLSSLPRFYPQISWKMVGLVVTLCSIVPGFWVWRGRKDAKLLSSSAVEADGSEGATVGQTADTNDAETTDPGLLRRHSEIKSYTTSRFTYPKLRIFYRKHPQADKLPKTPAPLPLLVFLHGLGGSVAQFHALLNTMVNISSCLAVDLPGCGRSTFSPTSWDAYKTEALLSLLETIIEDYREKDANQGVILLGHSMGCSLAAALASRNTSHDTRLAQHVVGLIAICPKAEPPSEEQVATFRKLLWVPNPIFDLWRRWDRRGGTESASVRRFVGADASYECRKLQYRFNEQSKTAVWRRMAWGSLPTFINSIPKGGLPGRHVWAGLEIPVFLVGGEMDNITPPSELAKIALFLGKSHPDQIEVDKDSQPVNDVTAPVSTSYASEGPSSRQIDSIRQEDFIETDPDSADSHDDPSTPNEELAVIPPQPGKPKKVLKRIILPAPASHALLYQPTEVRVLAGLISDFLSSQISLRLSLGWQLQFLAQNSKWDVKNLAKWEKVKPVSDIIAGIFRAMKTLREVDETHCPQVFVKNWGHSIKDVIDISHDNPVYDSRALERGGIHYHKFPTISKIPPTADEVVGFVALVDRLREEQKERAVKEGWGEYCIGVHCHYGFNRTGFFIVCYLVERCGYDVQSAIDEFAKQRPNGIKHAHFIDGLFVRYCKGLKRAPTI